jgi:hypothetical protein
LNSCYLNSCLLSIVRAFVSTRKCFLSLPQLISKALEVLGFPASVQRFEVALSYAFPSWLLLPSQAAQFDH